MAQLRRLRGQLDAQERVFTTVRGLADFVSSLGPTRGNTCAVRMCFFRGEHVSTESYSGTHLEFIDAESAAAFDEVRKMLVAMPLNIVGSENCRLTVWERADLALFTPVMPSSGTVYEIRHIFNFNLYNGMPQASATRACVEDRTARSTVDAAVGASDAQCPPPSTLAPPASEREAHQVQLDQKPDRETKEATSAGADAARPATAENGLESKPVARCPSEERPLTQSRARADPPKKPSLASNNNSTSAADPAKAPEHQPSSAASPPAKRTRTAK